MSYTQLMDKNKNKKSKPELPTEDAVMIGILKAVLVCIIVGLLLMVLYGLFSRQLVLPFL